MILKEKYTLLVFPLVGHFHNPTGYFWPAGMGLDGPALECRKTYVPIPFSKAMVARKVAIPLVNSQRSDVYRIKLWVTMNSGKAFRK